MNSVKFCCVGGVDSFWRCQQGFALFFLQSLGGHGMFRGRSQCFGEGLQCFGGAWHSGGGACCCFGGVRACSVLEGCYILEGCLEERGILTEVLAVVLEGCDIFGKY